MDSLFCARVINILLVQKRVDQGIPKEWSPIAKERMTTMVDRENCRIQKNNWNS